MISRNNVMMSAFIAVILFFSMFVLYLYKNQMRLEYQWEQSQQKTLFTPINQPNTHVVETMVTSAQLWRPVQDRVRDTVIQLFAQVSAVDLLEPY